MCRSKMERLCSCSPFANTAPRRPFVPAPILQLRRGSSCSGGAPQPTPLRQLLPCCSCLVAEEGDGVGKRRAAVKVAEVKEIEDKTKHRGEGGGLLTWREPLGGGEPTGPTAGARGRDTAEAEEMGERAIRGRRKREGGHREEGGTLPPVAKKKGEEGGARRKSGGARQVGGRRMEGVKGKRMEEGRGGGREGKVLEGGKRGREVSGQRRDRKEGGGHRTKGQGGGRHLVSLQEAREQLKRGGSCSPVMHPRDSCSPRCQSQAPASLPLTQLIPRCRFADSPAAAAPPRQVLAGRGRGWGSCRRAAVKVAEERQIDDKNETERGKEGLATNSPGIGGREADGHGSPRFAEPAAAGGLRSCSVMPDCTVFQN